MRQRGVSSTQGVVSTEHFNILITEMGVTVGTVAVTALVLERQKLIGGSCHQILGLKPGIYSSTSWRLAEQ